MSGEQTFLENVQSVIKGLTEWALVGAFLVFFYVVWPPVWPWESDKAVNYPLRCSEPYVEDVCPGKEWAGGKDTYRINRATNEIFTMWRSVDHIIALVDCKIFDEDNWVCRYDDNSGIVRMTNGLVSIEIIEADGTSKPFDARFRSVPHWRYQVSVIFGVVRYLWRRVLEGGR